MKIKFKILTRAIGDDMEHPTYQSFILMSANENEWSEIYTSKETYKDDPKSFYSTSETEAKNHAFYHFASVLEKLLKEE